MNILHITIVKTQATDKLCMTTDLPAACWPYKGNAEVIMEVAFDWGEEYVRQHFPNVPLKVEYTMIGRTTRTKAQ